MKKRTAFLLLFGVTFAAGISQLIIPTVDGLTPPGLGTYPNSEVFLSGNTVVTPTAAPANAVAITAVAPPTFKGLIAVDVSSGVMHVTNAFPVGTYSIIVTAWATDGSTATRTMTLMVKSSSTCDRTTFNQAPAFDVALEPRAVISEDFDGDQKPDVATTNYISQNVSVLRNTSVVGNVSFAPKVDFAGGAAGLTGADLDGDGKKDLVTANWSTPNVSVLRNTSSGVGNINFAPKIDFATASGPWAVTTGDVDGDGKLDIIVANASGASVSVLRNLSTGMGVVNFAASVDLAVGPAPRSVAAVDLDGDGKVDIATANSQAGSISVLRNTTSGTISFASRVDISVGTGFSAPFSVAAADFNVDGKPDLVSAEYQSNRALFLPNTSSGAGVISFGPKIVRGVGFFSIAVVATDLDGDGITDAAFANEGGTVSALRNISSGGTLNIEPRREFGARNTPVSLTASDFDGDGMQDLAVANSKSNDVSVLRNTRTVVGMIRFDARTEFALDTDGINPFSIAVGDFDRDGRQDLATPNLSSANISVFRNLSTISGDVPSLAPSVEFPSEDASNPYWIAVHDLDGDGKQDVVITNSALASVSVLRNTSVGSGSINFAMPVTFPVLNSPKFVTGGDLDGDGKYDLVVANSESSSLSVLNNTSPGSGTITFVPGLELNVNSTPTSISIEDFNGDGKLDVAATNRFGNTVSVFRNLTQGGGPISFSPKIDFTVNAQPLFLTAADLDGDQKPDLAVTNIVSPNGIITVLRNTSVASDITFGPKIDFPITSNPEFSLIPGHLTTGDLNGDGKSDLVVLNSALRSVSVLPNSSSGQGNINFSSRIDAMTSVATSALAVTDIDRDGKQDIAFASYNTQNVGILQNPCAVRQQGPYDFDGDGKTDLGIFRPSVAEWWINRSSNGTTFAAQFGVTTDKLAPGDYTGDGKADIAIWRPLSGEWFILRSEDSSFFSFPFGTTSDTPMPADYDADGKVDAAVFRSSNATWYVRRSSDNGTTIEGFGADGDVPVSADYDGDGKSDIAIYRPSLGQWWIKRSTAGVIAFTFGSSTDKPVQGDYTGDGKADVAFWRPSTGEWYILRSEDFSYYSQPFGTSTDIPSPGDYDGDGKFDPTVFRPSSATWFSNRSAAGTLIQQFGSTGDRPIPNAFVQ